MTTPQKKLPDGWRWVPLGEVCEVNPRKPSNLGCSADALTTFVPMSSVSETTGSIVQPHAKPFSEVSKGYTYFEERDVLFAKITPCMQNGKHAIARDLINGFGFGSTEFHVIRPSDKITSEWIHQIIRQKPVLDDAAKQFRGAVGQQRVPKEFLIDLRIPLPPLAEQQRIVTAIEAQMATVERARKAAEEALQAIKALNASLLRKLLPSLGQQLPQFWKWVKLGEVCEKIEISNPANRPDEQFTYVDISSVNRDTKTIVSPSLMMGKDAPSRARRVIRKGDVLIATTRPNLNSVALVPSDLDGQICSTGLCVLRPNNEAIDSRYLYYCTTHDPFVESLSGLVSGAMYPAVTDKQVFDRIVPLPPLDDQRRIVSELESETAATNRARQAAQDALDGLHQLPDALLRRAFTGEI